MTVDEFMDLVLDISNTDCVGHPSEI